MVELSLDAPVDDDGVGVPTQPVAQRRARPFACADATAVGTGVIDPPRCDVASGVVRRCGDDGRGVEVVEELHREEEEREERHDTGDRRHEARAAVGPAVAERLTIRSC